MRRDATPSLRIPSSKDGRKRRRRIPSAQIAQALAAAGGNLRDAAALLGCSRSQVHRRVVAEPALKAARTEATEELLDLAESSLMRKVKRGSLRAAMFVLETLGKSRGYTRRQEVDRPAERGALHVYVPQKDPLPAEDEPLATMPIEAPESASTPPTVH
jgi:hypothetical protein